MALSCRYCDRSVFRRDLCHPHYYRERRNGHPLAKPRPTPPPNFKGLGVIKCAICGRACRDHKLTETCL